MAREDLHFRLRIPDDLKRRIAAASRINERSMTAEIVARLEASFVVNPAPSIDPADQELADVLSDIERLKSKLIRLRKQKLR